MKRGVGVLLAAVVAVVVGVVAYLMRSGTGESVGTDPVPRAAAIASADSAQMKRLSDLPRPTRAKTPASSRAKPILIRSVDAEDAEDDDTRTPEERKLAEKIEKALEDEDFNLAISCAAEALVCKDSEIRQSMVDTLGWFGSRAIPELTPFLADSDEDIRDAAQMEWSNAISDVEDDTERVRIVELAMQALTNEGFLEELSNEYIGVDEAMAVESLLRVIESGGSEAGIAKAKETYEFVTGEEFTNRADAERWMTEQRDANLSTEER